MPAHSSVPTASTGVTKTVAEDSTTTFQAAEFGSTSNTGGVLEFASATAYSGTLTLADNKRSITFTPVGNSTAALTLTFQLKDGAFAGVVS